MHYERRRHKGNDYYYPVAQVVTAEGRVVKFEAARSQSGAEPSPGGTLEVLYDPQRPEAARLPGQDRAGALFAAAVGIVFLIVAVILVTVLLSR